MMVFFNGLLSRIFGKEEASEKFDESRRGFLIKTIVGVVAIANLEVLADDKNVPIFKGYEDKDLQRHDPLIKKWVDYWNSNMKERFENFRGLSYETVKRMALVETANGGKPSYAWSDNPMQIGNGGDPGLKVLQNGMENSNVLDEFSRIKDVKPAN